METPQLMRIGFPPHAAPYDVAAQVIVKPARV